jgi:hypothetical protein
MYVQKEVRQSFIIERKKKEGERKPESNLSIKFGLLFL